MTIADAPLSPKTARKLQRLTSLAEDVLPLQRWGFRRSAQFGGMPYELPSIVENDKFRQLRYPAVIYDSKWCRIKLTLDEDDNDSLYFYYGRAHAPNNEWRLEWQGVSCSCWHDFYDYNLALKFLDGLTPEQVRRDQVVFAKVIADYYSTEQTIQPSGNFEDELKMDLNLHAGIWEHYGERFLEIYDLSHPELWDRFFHFVQEIQRLRLHYPVRITIC